MKYMDIKPRPHTRLLELEYLLNARYTRNALNTPYSTPITVIDDDMVAVADEWLLPYWCAYCHRPYSALDINANPETCSERCAHLLSEYVSEEHKNG